MMIRMSEPEFVDLCNKMPLGELLEMSDAEYQQLVRKAETLAYRLRNFQTVRPLLVVIKTQMEVA